MSEPEPVKDLLSGDSKKVIAELSKLNDDNFSDEEKAEVIVGLKGKTITLNVDKLIGAAGTAGEMEEKRQGLDSGKKSIPGEPENDSMIRNLYMNLVQDIQS